jgi:hypothetical protein
VNKVRDRVEWWLIVLWTPFYFGLIAIDRVIWDPLTRVWSALRRLKP